MKKFERQYDLFNKYDIKSRENFLLRFHYFEHGILNLKDIKDAKSFMSAF